MHDLFLRDAPSRRAIHNEDFISVAITSFTRHNLLNNLIDSIHKHADMPFEIVVSDDGGALYNDFNFINNLKSRVSHFSLNLGRNKGLHCNTNAAVSLTKSKYVVNFYEDVEVQAPFMRKAVNLLKEAPHVGVIYLDKRPRWPFSKIKCKSHSGQEYNVFCQHGSEWASVFKKEYWIEVGGYGEDELHGDMPFMNRGWKKGYFSCTMNGPSEALDIDKVKDANDNWSAKNSSGTFIDGGYANYPKIFGITDDKLREMDTQRIHECSLWNAIEREHDYNASKEEHFKGIFREAGCFNWKRYIDRAVQEGEVDWNALSMHIRFLDSLKKDFYR